jgi:hypothetical protein
MNTTPETMRIYAIAAMLIVFAAVLLTGCDGASRTLSPSQVRVYTLAGDVHAEVTGSENTQGGRVSLARKADGTVTLDYTDKGSQWFSVPDFTGENVVVYVGIGLILLGVVSIWIPFLAPAKFLILGLGGAFIIGGSFMKREGFETLMFWFLAGGIVLVLGYLVYRYWSGLKEIVTGVEKSESDVAKQSIHEQTSHATDKIINGLTK